MWTPGRPTTPTSRRARLSSPLLLAILLDMPRTHVPVLAGELIEALDPHPGEIAIDCTLGAAGHARLVADRPGAPGPPVPVGRGPLGQKGVAQLAGGGPGPTPFLP